MLVQHNQFRLLAAYLLMLYLIKMEVLAAAGNLLARAMVYLNIRLAILLIRYGMASPIAAVEVVEDTVKILTLTLLTAERMAVMVAHILTILRKQEAQAVHMVVELV